MSAKGTIPRVCEQCGNPLTSRYQDRFCSRACADISKQTPLSVRFWSHVDKNGPIPRHCPELGPCWIWTGGMGDVGYGAIYANGQMQRAHRVSWGFHHGSIPKGEQVLHHCDNKPCVNPTHLHLGTQTQNMREAQERELFNSKLTAEDVRDIRRRVAVNGTPHRVLAAEYGVSTAAIDHVCNRRNWAHVD